MFTGIIQELAQVKRVDVLGAGREVRIACSDALVAATKIGGSIACNGVCSTVTAIHGECFIIQYLSETLAKTSVKEWEVGEFVNIEPAMRANDPYGGHMVTGHIDGMGVVSDIQQDGVFYRFTVTFPKENAVYVIPKGSISLDGISLTIVDVATTQLTVHIIPHTYQNTVLHTKQVGNRVNMEYDQVGKYLHRFYTAYQAHE